MSVGYGKGALAQRWIVAFCETPILIDADLVRRVFSDHDSGLATAVRTPQASRGFTGG